MLPLNPSAHARAYANLPEGRLLNMYFEVTPTGPGPVSLLQRPGLTTFENVGSAAVRGLLWQNGVDGTVPITVAGNTVYHNTTSKGTIGTSTGRCELSASADHVVIVDYGAATSYSYNGATVTHITDADLPSVASATFYQGRWYFAERDTGVFYWSAVGDPTSIDGLSFATAEGSPDETENIFALGDDLVIAGHSSIEFFYGTADADEPVQRYTNRSFTVGCNAKWTLVLMDNTFFFVGDGIPYRAGSVPVALVDPQTGEGYAVVEAIRQAPDYEDVFAFSASFQGHIFYVVTVPTIGTWAYDITTRRWSQWTRGGDATFQISCGARGDDTLSALGSSVNGKVYVWGDSTYQDDGSAMERIASTYIPAEGPQRNNRVRLTTTNSAESSVDLRWFDTSWSSWTSATTLNGKADWRRLGKISAPGRRLEFRCTANADVSFVGYDLNPARP